MQNYRKDLEKKITTQTERWEKAKQNSSTLAQLSMLGSIGLLFIIPVVIGAYVGSWLDDKLPDFSTSWTVSLIIVGVVAGAVNVYLYVRNSEDD